VSTISVQDIQRDPLAFVRRLEAGEALLVVDGDRALAEILPIQAVAPPVRPFGLCAGQFTVPAEFEHPLPDEVIAEFEGR
jgi:antitoxin (DNA-binding transcriptional repressor) of toxin-antitoxin stability system